MIYSWWYGSTLASILTSISNFISSAGYTAIFGFVFALGLIFSLLAYLVNSGKHIDYFSIAKVYLVSFIIYGFAVTSMRSYTVYDECTGVQTSVNAPFIIGFPLEVVTSIEEYLRTNLAQYLPLPPDMQANGGCFSGYQLLKPAVVYNIIEPYTRESMIEYMKDCVFPSIQAGDISMDSLYNSNPNPNTNLWSNVACNTKMLCASLDTYYYSGNDATFYSQTGHQSGLQVTCPNAHSYISADLAKQLTNKNPNYYLGYTAVAMQALGTANLSTNVNSIPDWLQDESGVLMQNSYAASDLLTQAVAIQEFANASAQFGEGLAYSETYLSNLAKIEALSFGAGGSLESTKGLLEIFFAGSAPIFILLWLTPLGRASFLSFLQMLIWIPMWSVASEVVAAILELMVGGNNKFDLTIAQISNMTTVFNKAAQQAILLNHLVPLFTFAFATGSVYALTKVATAAGEMMMAGSRQGAELMTTGNLSAGNQQLDTLNALNSSIGNMQYDMFSMYGSSIGNNSLYNTQVGNKSFNNRNENVFTNTPITTPSGQKVPVTGTYQEIAPGVYSATGPVQLDAFNGPVTINPYDGSARWSIDKNGHLHVEQGIMTVPMKNKDGNGIGYFYFSNGKMVKGEEDISNGKSLLQKEVIGEPPVISLFSGQNEQEQKGHEQIIQEKYESPEILKIDRYGNIAKTIVGDVYAKTLDLINPANLGLTWTVKNEKDMSKLVRNARTYEHDVGSKQTAGHKTDHVVSSGVNNSTATEQGDTSSKTDSQAQSRDSYRLLETYVGADAYLFFKAGGGVKVPGFDLINIQGGLETKAGGGARYYDSVKRDTTQTHTNANTQSSSVHSASVSFANVANSSDSYKDAQRFTQSIQKSIKSIESNKALKTALEQNPSAVVAQAIDALAKKRVLAEAQAHHMTEAQKLIKFQEYAQKYLAQYNALGRVENVSSQEAMKILKTDAAILKYINNNYEQILKNVPLKKPEEPKPNEETK